MDTIRAPLIEPRNNTECIDEESINLIKYYLEIWEHGNFKEKHPNVDDFFTQIEFNKYLMQFYDRLDKLESMFAMASSSRSTQITINSEFPIKLREKNTTCLEFAKKVERLANEEYNKFKTLSDSYTSNTTGKYGDSFSIGSSFKGLFRFGTKSKYERMVNDIPLCLYWTMFKFAEAILEYENKLSSQRQYPSADVSDMQQQVSNTSFGKLSELLQNLIQSEDNLGVEGGGSRRHTRRHRHGRTRRHHSKHSHKSVKRSKKGKKIMKSHTRKRHTHARKQNRRRNRSRK